MRFATMLALDMKRVAQVWGIEVDPDCTTQYSIGPEPGCIRTRPTYLHLCVYRIMIRMSEMSTELTTELTYVS